MSLSRKIFSHWKNFYSRLKPILGVKIHFQSTITVLASIVTILVNFEAILIYSKAYCKKITLKLTCRVDIYKNPLQYCFKTYKYCDNNCKYCTCRWTHFSSIGSILVSIATILTSIVTILASIEQVNRPLDYWKLWLRIMISFIKNVQNVA